MATASSNISRSMHRPKANEHNFAVSFEVILLLCPLANIKESSTSESS